MFNTVNHSKKSIALNLKHPEAAELLRALAGKCDVLVENYATGALERMGIDVDLLLQDNPRLIVASSSGFGRTGPYADWVAYGNNVHAASGLTHLIHYDPEQPLGLLGVWSDPVAAYSLAFGIVTALQERSITGVGGRLDLSMLEASALMLTSHLVKEQIPHPPVPEPPLFTLSKCFRCAGDGDEWVAISLRDELDVERLGSALDQPSLINDARLAVNDGLDCNLLIRSLERLIGALPRYEVTKRLLEYGVPVGESLSTSQMMSDEHLQERGFFRLIAHPDTGVTPVLRPAWRRRSGYSMFRAPKLGEHTDEVLRDVLGLSSARIAQMRSVEQLLY